MKLKTVALVSVAAMMLTSVTVWSLTPSGRALAVAEPGAELGDLQGSDKVVGRTRTGDRWNFVDGRTLTVEGRLGHAKLAADRDNETYLFLDVKAALGVVPKEAPPLELAIVVDRSGSMSGHRLTNAIAAARGLVSRLRDGDLVSITAYDDRSELLVPPTRISSFNRSDVLRRIDGIVAGGNTCISCGLESAMSQLAARTDGVKRIVLLSDGEPTAGVRDVSGFATIATRARNLGASISAIGVDVDYNERIMSQIARGSNGRHTFVASPAELAAVFEEEQRSLANTIATGAELRVELARGVEVLEVFDRAFSREGDTLVVPMGSFGTTDDKTLLVRVRLPRGPAGERPVATAKLTFRDHVTLEPGSCTGSLVAELTGDDSELSPIDPLVAGRIERSQTAALLIEANDRFASGDNEGARRLVEHKRAALKKVAADAAPRASAPRKAELDRDFARQDDALHQASEGFAAPPPAAANAAPADIQRGKAGMKRNSAASDGLSF